MPPISSIKRLPPELRRAIEEQLAAGRSLDEITAHVRTLGADVSRSSIWRYKRGFEKILARAERSRQVAEVLVRSRSGAAEKEAILSGVEILQGLLLDVVESLDGEDKKITPEELMRLATALEKTSRAAKTGAELERLRADNARTIVDAEASTGRECRQIEITFAEPAHAPEDWGL